MKHLPPPTDGAQLECPQDVAEALATLAGQGCSAAETSPSDAERRAAGRANLARLRKEAEAHIERLIELLDLTDSNAALEPEVDCCPTEEGEEDLSDREPSLGWCEGMAQGPVSTIAKRLLSRGSRMAIGGLTSAIVTATCERSYQVDHGPNLARRLLARSRFYPLPSCARVRPGHFPPELQVSRAALSSTVVVGPKLAAMS